MALRALKWVDIASKTMGTGTDRQTVASGTQRHENLWVDLTYPSHQHILLSPNQPQDMLSRAPTALVHGEF